MVVPSAISLATSTIDAHGLFLLLPSRIAVEKQLHKK